MNDMITEIRNLERSQLIEEIERLDTLYDHSINERVEHQHEIKLLKDLITRAADALEGKPVYDAVANYRLIQELRDAAR